MTNAFARYVHNNMVVFEYELPGLIPFDWREMDEAIASGDVNKTPVSVNSERGAIYWASDVLVQVGMHLAADRVASYVSGGEIVGTPRTVAVNDDLFNPRTAQAVLSFGRYAGLFDEHVIGGVDVYVRKE